MAARPCLLGMVAVAVVACGASRSTPSGAEPDAIKVPAAATPRDATDAVVATVDGRPIHASCVRGYMTRHGWPRARALDECIAFELLADAARTRLALSDPELVETWRTLLADAVVRRLFAEGIATPQALPVGVQAQVLKQYRRELQKPELRRAYQALFPFPRGTAVDSDADRAAAAAAAAFYAPFAGQVGVLRQDFLDAQPAAVPALADYKPQLASVFTPRTGAYEPGFLEALFAPVEAGRVSPPARTAYGWHVVFVDEIYPAETLTEAALLARKFDETRRAVFPSWATDLARAAGIVVKLAPDHEAQLEAVGEGVP